MQPELAKWPSLAQTLLLDGRQLADAAPRQFVARHRSSLRAQHPGQNALLDVHAVARLLDDNAPRTIDYLVSDLLAAMCRQAMHEECALLGM